MELYNWVSNGHSRFTALKRSTITVPRIIKNAYYVIHILNIIYIYIYVENNKISTNG